MVECVFVTNGWERVKKRQRKGNGGGKRRGCGLGFN